MMDKRDLAALVQLLNRTPMSPAEQLWVQNLIAKLEAMAQPRKEETGVGGE